MNVPVLKLTSSMLAYVWCVCIAAEVLGSAI